VRIVILSVLVILASAADPACAQRPAHDPYALIIPPERPRTRIPFNYDRVDSAAETFLPKEPVCTPANVPAEYRIGPEDVLQIAVWKNEALSRTVPVRPDGKISFPLLYDVQAAGLTPAELRDVLRAKLEEFVPNPEVNVIVTEARSFKSVSVMGVPLYLDPASCVTALDALRTVGFTQFEKGSKIVIFHPEGTTMKRIPFNYRDVAVGERDKFCLRPGDIILMP